MKKSCKKMLANSSIDYDIRTIYICIRRLMGVKPSSVFNLLRLVYTYFEVMSLCVEGTRLR